MTAELSAPLVKHWSYCISWSASLIRNNYTQTQKGMHAHAHARTQLFHVVFCWAGFIDFNNTHIVFEIKKKAQTNNTAHETASLPGCLPSCDKVLFPHFPHWCAPYCQCSNWCPNHGSIDITWYRMWHNGISGHWLCACLCTNLTPFHILRWQRVMQRDVIGYFLHEPLEAFTSMFLPDIKSQMYLHHQLI